jgi:hypothetical protein
MLLSVAQSAAAASGYQAQDFIPQMRASRHDQDIVFGDRACAFLDDSSVRTRE